MDKPACWDRRWRRAPDHVQQSDLVTGQRRFAMSAPDLLIGIGAQGVAHFRKARTGIGAIFLRDVLRSQMVHAHGKRSCSNRRISGYEIDCLAAFKSLRKTAGSGLAADSSPSACHRDCVGNGTPPDSLVEARRSNRSFVNSSQWLHHVLHDVFADLTAMSVPT
jgi:hypothetical protein